MRVNDKGVCLTLMTKPYSHFDKQEMNGVLEWKLKD